MNISVPGIELGKRAFYVVSHDERGNELLPKQLTRVKLLALLQ
ncbi:hypothetical protein [Ferrimonas lipolytica]|nr:hypothetical protein [Ferrimonas lipolytica]